MFGARIVTRLKFKWIWMAVCDISQYQPFGWFLKFIQLGISCNKNPLILNVQDSFICTKFTTILVFSNVWIFFLSKIAFEHLAVSGVPNVDFLHVTIRIIRFPYLVSFLSIILFRYFLPQNRCSLESKLRLLESLCWINIF